MTIIAQVKAACTSLLACLLTGKVGEEVALLMNRLTVDLVFRHYEGQCTSPSSLEVSKLLQQETDIKRQSVRLQGKCQFLAWLDQTLVIRIF
jgi:hypothetical protein